MKAVNWHEGWAVYADDGSLVAVYDTRAEVEEEYPGLTKWDAGVDWDDLDRVYGYDSPSRRKPAIEEVGADLTDPDEWGEGRVSHQAVRSAWRRDLACGLDHINGLR